MRAIIDAMSPQTKGIAAMALAAALLSCHDAITKHLAESYPIGQVIVFRQLASLALVMAYVGLGPGWRTLAVNSVRAQALRATTFVAATAFIVISISVLPLATALSVVFASPLVLAALSVPLLGERVGPHRWLAILGGFVGVLVIIRPIDPSFNLLLLVPVCAAVSSALRDITTRQISRTETPLSILFWSNIAVIAAASLTLPFGIKAIAAVDCVWLGIVGLINITAHLLMISALRIADAALVAPFRYSALIWATALGFAIWGHIPDVWTFVGAAIIVASGIFLLIREQRAVRSAQAAE